MSLTLSDTIAAVASPAAAARRGIIRVSGMDTAGIAAAVFRPTSDVSWQHHRLPFRTEGFAAAASIGIPIPCALMFWPTHRSYTGQPMAEFHTIGSPPLLEAILHELCDRGARPAERGEFTMRAFLAGRIDLVQAEAVLGVIDAAEHAELETALTQLGGGVTARLNHVRSTIVALLGDLEAGLDFVEEDINFISNDEIVSRINNCLQVIQDLCTDASGRLPSATRQRVVLAGLPNAGKSTLFNRLIGDEKAIISSVAGTTRDYLSAPLDLKTAIVDLIDTAGWDDIDDSIMAQAQALRSGQLSSADLILWCTSALLSEPSTGVNRQLREQLDASANPVIDVITQCDRLPGFDDTVSAKAPAVTADALPAIPVSAVNNSGLESLKQQILGTLHGMQSGRGELLATTAVRCRDSLSRTLESLRNARDSAVAGLGDELISIELRDVLHQLRAILGEVYTDDLLDHIFSSFCIGK